MSLPIKQSSIHLDSQPSVSSPPGVRLLFARVDHKRVPQEDTSYEAYWGWFTYNGFI